MSAKSRAKSSIDRAGCPVMRSTSSVTRSARLLAKLTNSSPLVSAMNRDMPMPARASTPASSGTFT